MIGEVDHEVDIENHLELEAGASRTSLILQEQSLRRTSLVSLDHFPLHSNRRNSLTFPPGTGSLFPPSGPAVTPQARSRSRAPSPHAPANSPMEGSGRRRGSGRSPSPAIDPLEPLRSRSRGRSGSPFSNPTTRTSSPLATPTPSRPHSPSPLATPTVERTSFRG